MLPGYQILVVTRFELKTVAVLPLKVVTNHEHGAALTHDFSKLAKIGDRRYVIDLRELTSVEGGFFNHLLKFRKDVSDSGAEIVLVPSGVLKQVFDVIKLDKVFTIQDST